MSDSGCLGAQINGEQLIDFMDNYLESNLVIESTTGKRPTPLCIWGTHGLGKTEIAMELAKKKKWKIAYCAPAQFEEMGDLHGLPFKFDPDPTVIGDERTVYMTPEWVPKDEGPGILLLDDINRADDRILRGTMQLLQNFEMFSWSLPPKWQIIVTANPDSGDYSVTSMDEAIVTRMIHLTLNFDVKIWSEWALNSGIDERGVNFVLTYPEMVTLKRTTPRTLVHFFSHLSQIKDLKKDIFIVEILAKGCLDSITAEAFINYVDELLIQLPTPDDFLKESNLNEVDRVILTLLKTTNGIRLDSLNTLLTRILFKLKSNSFKPTEASQKVIEHILMHNEIPLDLRYAFHVDLNKIKSSASPSQQLIMKIMTNKEILSQFVKMI
jgi:MoxR-like ATPase